MEIDAAREEYQQKVLKAKDLINRMNKGKQIIEDKLKKNEVNSALKAIRLYFEISSELFNILEECTLLHEHYSFGKKILLKRSGDAVNVKEMFAAAGDKVEVSPWELESLQILEKVFGEGIKELVEFTDTPSRK